VLCHVRNAFSATRPCLGQQLYIPAIPGSAQTLLKMSDRPLLLPTQGRCLAQGIVHPRNEHLADHFPARSPFLCKAGELARGFHVSLLLMPGCGEQSQAGPLRMVIQGFALDPGQAFPVTELPLGACTFEKMIIIILRQHHFRGTFL
jgi:hypothetical protein